MASSHPSFHDRDYTGKSLETTWSGLERYLLLLALTHAR
jgi:hypothetical protein